MDTASLAIPAVALAGAAYLNARWRVSVDLHLLRSVIGSRRAFQKRERADRVNSFYFLEEHANNPKVAGEPFVIYEGKQWTFKETYDTVLRYAGWLHTHHSVVPGEIIGIDFMNNPQFIFLTLALWSLGAVPALINYNLTAAPFVHSVRTSSARLLIVDPEIEAKVLTPETKEAFDAPNFRNDAFPLDVVVLDQGMQSSLNYFPSYRAPDTARAGVTARSPSVLIFTSGTTGLPKAAIVPWERVIHGSGVEARWIQLRPVTSSKPDRYYTSMPLYHTSAFVMGFHGCLINASTLVLGHKFSVGRFWDDVVAADATVIQYVGETLRYLLTAPPRPDDSTRHHVRLAFGNGLRPDVWDKFRSRFGVETIAEFYGATEGVSASFNLSRNTFSSGAIGSVGLLGQLLAKSTQAIVKVDWETEAPYRDPDRKGFCVPVQRGEPGELLHRLDAKDLNAKYQGYFGNKEASASKIMRDVLAPGDAWFRTGDVVKMDGEGRVWFSDRIGDTFRWRSENVSTAEAAQVLGQHPAVLEANVYGVQVPGHEGRAGCAAVLLKEDVLVKGVPFKEDDVPVTTSSQAAKASTSEDVTSTASHATSLPKATSHAISVPEDVLESIATFARNSLPKYAVPLFLRIVPAVMATGNNKQQKHILRQQGVDPAAVGSDRLFYLRPDSTRYEPFGHKEWDQLKAGKVKL